MTENKDKQKSNEREMTAQDVADHFGVSRQAIADIEKRALMKCRKIIRLTSMMKPTDILPD